MQPIPTPKTSPDRPNVDGDSNAADRRFGIGDVVPFSGDWKPSCDEAERHLKKGQRFPACMHRHSNHSWILLSRD